MGDTLALGVDDVVALIEVPQPHVAEVDRPHAVVDLLEPDGMLFECLGEEDEFALAAEEDRPGVGDAFDDEVARVLDRRQRAGIRPRRRPIERRWRAPVEGVMRPFIVIEPAEGVEGPLLGNDVRARWSERLAFERLVHPLMRAVLLRMRRQRALVLNAEPQPPDVELREAVEAGGGEGRAIVGANGARQAVFAKESVEDWAHAFALG